MPTFSTPQIIKAIYTAVLVLAILNLVGSNILATKGTELNQINHQIYQQTRQNEYLEQLIAEHTSLSRIQALADDLGFVAVQKPVALASSAPVAYIDAQ